MEEAGSDLTDARNIIFYRRKSQVMKKEKAIKNGCIYQLLRWLLRWNPADIYLEGRLYYEKDIGFFNGISGGTLFLLGDG